jgi:LPXTG-site transpeptidase (sortase) family protein
MTSRGLILQSVERACIAAAIVLGGWSLMNAARSHFYSSLPVPAGPTLIQQLPGDSGEPAPSAAPRPAATPLRAGDYVARLEAPSVGLVATVLEGSTDDTLAKAAGHIEETPVPGESGNVGIAGHRDTTFRRVRNLAVGDTLTLTTTSGRFDYRITRMFIVAPDAVSVLDPTVRPSLTLVTCYPFTFIGHAPKRYIVQAELQGTSGS